MGGSSLKESLRATLAYIQEDLTDKEYSEKTKLKSLIMSTPELLTPETHLETFDIILEMEEQGLETIMSTEIKVLEDVRKSLKKIISVYLGERL